jgi:predicted nucleic acid-binding protein
MKGIADTGLVVAFLNRRDHHHAWAVRLARGIGEPLATCEAVIAKSFFHVGSAEHVLALVREGMLRVDFDFNAHQDRLETLAKRHADRSPDLADLCLICLSERFPDHPVLTVVRLTAARNDNTIMA